MKRTLLVLTALVVTLSYGQTVKENRISFNFIQLPSQPFSDGVDTYSVLVERKYEQANEDSLTAYQQRLEQATLEYEAQMAAWKEQRKNVMRDYYSKMSAWQKQVNAGNTAAPKPTDPIIPIQPIQPEVKDPRLHSDVSDDAVSGPILLAGMNRGEGGAVITIGVMPLSNVSIKMTQKKSGTTVKYTYTANYRLPLEVKVEDPSQGVIFNTIAVNGVRTKVIGTYDSQYDYDIWWMDNEESFWTELESTARSTAYTSLNTTLNNQHAYPVKSRSMEIFTVKKFKEHQYNDLTNAYTAASQGYQMVQQSRERAEAEGKLREAIKIWEQMLTESNPGDKKSRVNEKVTALLWCNLAEAHMWLAEFDKAEMYINQAINGGVGKFKRVAQGMKSFMLERKSRWLNNH